MPDPVKVVLLAALSAKLPGERAATVELHIDAIGVLDLGRKELSLDASLRRSRILTFALSGDMALRLNWGSEPNFALSLGGWHPRFTPPKGLRPLNRLALTLTTGTNPTVRFEAYFALTANTIQLGAKATFRLEAAGFVLEGGGSFDALVQWSPFALEIAFGVWFTLSLNGAALLALGLLAEGDRAAALAHHRHRVRHSPGADGESQRRHPPRLGQTAGSSRWKP